MTGAPHESPPDPVAEPNAYRRMLLTALGDRDALEVQAELADRAAALLRDAGTDASERPAEGEWSAIEILGHLVDAEITYAWRYRMILAEDEPSVTGMDQDRWAARFHRPEDDPGPLLELLRTLRRSHLDMWRRSTEDDRGRVGIHAERGPESYELSFRLIAGHGVVHLEQMRSALESVQARRASG